MFLLNEPDKKSQESFLFRLFNYATKLGYAERKDPEDLDIPN